MIIHRWKLFFLVLSGEVARIGNIVSPVLHHPAKGEPGIITTTISFDSENLIRHYAGYDNIPCNFDDVSVFPSTRSCRICCIISLPSWYRL